MNMERPDINRRDLLRTGVGVAAGATLLGVPSVGTTVANAADAKILPKALWVRPAWT